MITLEQIRLLEDKIQKAISTISGLREENATLRKKLQNYENRISELEVLIDDFKKDQNEIEQGIVNALKQLDTLEDEIQYQSAEQQTEGTPKKDADNAADTKKESSDNDESSNVEVSQVNNDTDDTESNTGTSPDPIAEQEEANRELHDTQNVKDSSEEETDNEESEQEKEPNQTEGELDIF